MSIPLKIGVTGGIGSGKSYICNLFKQNHDISVFDTDTEVKYDIVKRHCIKKQIINAFGQDSYISDGNINREKFIDILFKNSHNLEIMNSIISPELILTINNWVDKQTGSYVLIEGAVIYESGIDWIFDNIYNRGYVSYRNKNTKTY